jgi:hypothetical protein
MGTPSVPAFPHPKMVKIFETNCCCCVWLRPAPYRRLLNALYAKKNPRDVSVQADTSKLANFAVASPTQLPSIGLDLERKARRYLASNRLGFLMITLQAFIALVRSCSSAGGPDASSLALFEEHVAAVLEMCLSYHHVRVRRSAFELCAQFLEGQDYIFQARFEVYLGPILNGCGIDANDSDSADARAAAFRALKLLLGKSDVQGLENYVQTVVPALLALLFPRLTLSLRAGRAVIDTVADQCNECLLVIAAALNPVTAGFIYAPVLRFLDFQGWQPVTAAVHVLLLFDPGAGAAAFPGARPASDAIVSSSRESGAAGVFGTLPATLSHRPAFGVPITVTLLRHLAFSEKAFAKVLRDALRLREDSSADGRGAVSPPQEPAQLSRLAWLYPGAASAVDVSSLPQAAPPRSVLAAAAHALPRLVGAVEVEFRALRLQTLRVLLEVLRQPSSLESSGLSAWIPECIELLVPVVCEAGEQDTGGGRSSSSSSDASSAPALSEVILEQIAEGLRAPHTLAKFLAELLDCYASLGLMRDQQLQQRGSRSLPPAPSAGTGHRLFYSQDSEISVAAPSSRHLASPGSAAAPLQSTAGTLPASAGGRPRGESSAGNPIGPSLLIMRAVVFTATRLRQVLLQLREEQLRQLAASSDGRSGFVSGAPLVLQRDSILALELSMCDQSLDVQQMGLIAWHHILAAGVETGWPASDVDGPLAISRQATTIVSVPLAPMLPAPPTRRGVLDELSQASLSTGVAPWPIVGAAAVDSTPSYPWLGLPASALSGVRVQLPPDSLGRLLSALVHQTIHAAAAFEVSMGMPSERGTGRALCTLEIVALAVRVFRDILRVGPIEGLWKVLPATFALLTSTLDSLEGSESAVVDDTSARKLLFDAALGTSSSRDIPSSVPASDSTRVFSAANANVSHGSCVLRIAAASVLTTIATAVGVEQLRELARELLPFQQPEMRVYSLQVTRGGWFVFQDTRIATAAFPVDTEDFLKPTSIPCIDVTAREFRARLLSIRARSADLVLTSPVVLQGLLDRLGLEVASRAASAQESGDLPTVNDAGTSTAPLQSAEGAHSVPHSGCGAARPFEVPASNGVLPKRMRKFRSDRSLAAAAAVQEQQPADTLLVTNVTASSSASSATAGVAGDFAPPTPQHQKLTSPNPASADATLLASLISLPLRLRPSRAALNQLVYGSDDEPSPSDAGSGEAEAGAGSSAATASNSRETSAAVPAAAPLSLTTLPSTSGDSGSIAATGPPGSGATENSVSAIAAPMEVYSSVFVPANGAPLPGLQDLFALLDGSIQRNMQRVGAVRDCPPNGLKSLETYESEPECERIWLAPYRADALLRLTADPGTLAVLEAAHVRGLEEKRRAAVVQSHSSNVRPRSSSLESVGSEEALKRRL